MTRDPTSRAPQPFRIMNPAPRSRSRTLPASAPTPSVTAPSSAARRPSADTAATRVRRCAGRATGRAVSEARAVQAIVCEGERVRRAKMAVWRTLPHPHLPPPPHFQPPRPRPHGARAFPDAEYHQSTAYYSNRFLIFDLS